MKKIISLFILFLSFSFSVNAQETNKEDAKTLATNDLKALTEFLTLDDQSKKSFYGLFLNKHKKLANGVKEEKEKAELANIISLKIESSLSSEQFLKLKNNKELFEKLTH